MTAIPAALEELLMSWLPAQRWFPAKGVAFSVADAGVVELPVVDAPADPAGVRIEHRLLAVTTEATTQVVQVPLVFRDGAAQGSQPAPQPGVIGTVAAGAGTELVLDGPHDPAYVAALLSMLEDQASVTGSVSITGRHTDGWVHDVTAPAKVLTGEQSNTSIIVDSQPKPLMVKLFRVITDGPNPDVEVTSALSAAGVNAVAHVAGWLEGRWTAPEASTARGHLAVSAEFLAGSQDAWREAVTAVRNNVDFSEAAQSLGEATAQVHRAMADSFGTIVPTQAQVRDLAAELQARVAWALSEVPALRSREARLRAHADSLSTLTVEEVGELQRVHGDFHLGQVLHAPGRGWVLLDFEGEPLRPLAQRVKPDVALRDVVGMLRSFDYAAGFVTVEEPDLAHQNQAWAAACTASFLRGYRKVSGQRPAGRLFDALLLDKALYEVVYEARNRPDWINIPLAAVARSLDS